MWTPANNNNEEFYPPNESLKIGATYRCEMACPEDARDRTYKLRVMGEADFSSGDLAQAAKNVLLADATLDDEGRLSGAFTPQADWPQSVRVGFVDATGEAFGLGGTQVISVG